MKCICQICSCGKHRCPHYMPQRPVTNKQPCVLSEYQGRYREGDPTHRNPISRPVDNLKQNGDVDYNTTHKEKFPAHKVQRKVNHKPQEGYVKRSDPMDLNTEYGVNYLKGKGESIPLPQYFKKKTQPYSDGNEFADKSVTHEDFHKKQPGGGLPKIYRHMDNYVFSDEPFNSKSTHQEDFTKFQNQQKTFPRRPDNIDTKGMPGYYDTTHNEHFKRHNTRPTPRKAPQEDYQPNSQPFLGKSLMKEDYKHHRDASKSSMIRYDNNLFASEDPLNDETTHATTYKNWGYQKREAKGETQLYRPPSGKMDLQTTSDDYKNFGGKIASKSMRPGTNINFGDDFDGVTSYQDGYIQHNVTPRQRPHKDKEYYHSSVPFDGITENQDRFKRFTTAPAHMINRDTEMIDRSAPFANETSYDNHFQGKRLPECPSTKILGSNFAGYKIIDDFDTGHRFLTKEANNQQVREKSPPLPPIGQTNLYVSVH